MLLLFFFGGGGGGEVGVGGVEGGGGVAVILVHLSDEHIVSVDTGPLVRLLRGVIFVIRTISFLALMWLVGSKHQTNTNTICHSFTAKIPVYRDEFGRPKTGFSSSSCNIHGHFCLFACFQTVQTWCSDGAK